MGLGRIGVWLGELALRPAVEEREVARELEALGYHALWFGETPTNKEALTHAALLLGWTERIAVATGIASIWLREPAAAANGAAALADAYPGRFVLGLGVSHAPIVASVGREYARPLTRMREYLDGMDAVTYRAAAPAEPAPRVLAALAPRMLELARDRAGGAHPYLVTPGHTAAARAALGEGPLLAPEQAFTLAADATAAREAGRRHLRYYLGADNYRRSWLRQGFSEQDLEAGGSDALVDALVAWGGETAVRARIEEHFAAGADHVAVQAVGPDPLGELRRLAGALDL